MARVSSGQFGPDVRPQARTAGLQRFAPACARRARRRRSPAARLATDGAKRSSVSRLIQFYANRGHLIADIDPLGLMQRPMPRVLDPAYVGLTEADMKSEFYTASRTSGVDKADEAVRDPEAAPSRSTPAASAPSSRTSRRPKSGCGSRTASRKGG